MSGSFCSLPSTVTTCRSTSIRTGPASNVEGESSGSVPRRRTARMRATSSRGEYGLVT